VQSLSNLESLTHFVPELALASFAVVVLIADLLARGRGSQMAAALALLSLVVVGAIVAAETHDGELLFMGMVRHDAFSQFLKVLIAVCGATTVVVSWRAPEIDGKMKGEYYTLLLFAIFGMFLMVSAANLVLVYIAVEMASISSYLLAGFVTSRTRSSEAAFKYVIYGSVASGVMLFGISLLFGMAGGADIAGMSSRLVGAPNVGVVLALVLVFAGIGYKIASVPFHMWSPDVYEGSPLPVTAFLSVASKAAGFGLAIRFFYDGWASASASVADWPTFVALVSVLTMTVGNFAAIGQRNLKRLLAYSSIAHGGYLLMGVAAMGGGSSEPIAPMLFYLVVYLFMNLGAFYIVLHLSHPSRLGSETIDGYRGLVRRNPWLAVSMSVFLFSLIGLPPFAGFWGKLYLFKSVIDRSLAPGGIAGHNFTWLVVVGLLNSAVSLYYYFSVVKAMLLDAGEEEGQVRAHPAFAVLLLLLLIPTLLLGFVTTSDDPWVRDASLSAASTSLVP